MQRRRVAVFAVLPLGLMLLAIVFYSRSAALRWWHVMLWPSASPHTVLTGLPLQTSVRGAGAEFVLRHPYASTYALGSRTSGTIPMPADSYDTGLRLQLSCRAPNGQRYTRILGEEPRPMGWSSSKQSLDGFVLLSYTVPGEFPRAVDLDCEISVNQPGESFRERFGDATVYVSEFITT